MLHGVRVLVADDDPDSLRTVADALERLGATCARVESGGEMIERMADEGPFALIVTDINMPWMSGTQAMYAVRHAGLTTPVIVMTALTDERIPVDVKRLGAHAVLLRKPFDLGSLETTAERLLAAAP
jgi:two-component system response regulator TctD